MADKLKKGPLLLAQQPGGTTGQERDEPYGEAPG